MILTFFLEVVGVCVHLVVGCRVCIFTVLSVVIAYLGKLKLYPFQLGITDNSRFSNQHFGTVYTNILIAL